MSQSPYGHHYGKPQNIFVNVGDVRAIIHSIATNTPLDSARFRNAYHADVNHNGRFYYKDTTLTVKDIRGNDSTYFTSLRKEIHYKDYIYYDNLPFDVGNFKNVLFQANEYDAGLILQYLSNRVPELPWLLDTTVQTGKINANLDYATNLRFGAPMKIDGNMYRIPVYINGLSNGPTAGKFNVNAVVKSIEIANKDDQNFLNSFSDKIVAFATNGNYDESSPIFYLTVESTTNQIAFTGVRFNDKNVDGAMINISGIENNDCGCRTSMDNKPNPVTSQTTITANIKEEGNYTINIYNSTGSVVYTLVNAFLSPNVYTFDWNGTDAQGNSLSSGVYFYTLSGTNVNITNKLLLTK
jgi:hypothetical protein